MRRIRVRLVLSHVLVAIVAVLTTFLVVRWFAPGLFDAPLRRAQVGPTGQPMPSMPPGRGPGAGAPGATLRDELARAVDQSLLVGATVGAVVAALVGVVVAVRLGASLRRLQEATRRMATGDYEARVPLPGETELAAVAADVNTLGAALAATEQRRLRLLGEVAHEMRTPLTVIDGFVEGMIDDVLPRDHSTLVRLAAESRRLRRLADDLSALSRAEEGRLDLSRARLDLRSIARDAAERLRPQTDDAGLTLTVSPGSGPLVVDADADRLAQVVTNLVGNAIRATPAGGHVGVATSASGGEAVLTVSDTGEGLDEAQLERVFERFYRVPGRRSAWSDEGSGIGLTIARRIARLHGGDLVATSGGQGQGATFTLTLPRAPGA